MGKSVAAWLLMAAATTSALSPLELVQNGTTRVITILQDPSYSGAIHAQKRRLAIRGVAEDLFDFSEMARRSMGKHWKDRTKGERDEFVRVFTDLLERTYVGVIESYAGEKLVYQGEWFDGAFAIVKTRIVFQQRGADLPIEYRLHQVGSRWAVYDVVVDGVSFVSNYRSQFDRVITTSSYGALVQKMRQKDGEIVFVRRVRKG
jgi:phospholipid transport system substrate-binding protein